MAWNYSVYEAVHSILAVTNITHEHLDFHKTLANYRRAKARLFEMLEPARDKGLGVHPYAILNRDDSSYEILKTYCRVPTRDRRVDERAMVRAVDVQLSANNTRFQALLPDTELVIERSSLGISILVTAWKPSPQHIASV